MRGLGGATRKEQTRDELLEAVRAERAARSGVKHRARAALVIQRAWRGHLARRRLREALVAEWAAMYGPMVAAPEARLSGRDVADKLLPPLLFLLKPAGGSSAAAAAAAAAAAPSVAASLVLPPPGSPLSNMIRGSLALLLRTCSATDPRNSYLALALAAEEARRATWRDQAWRLLATCCRLVAAPPTAAAPAPAPAPAQAKTPQQQQQQQQPAGPGVGPGGGDPVIDAAAIRLAVLLTDASSWKCLGAGSAGGGAPERASAEAAAAHLRSRLAQQPHSLFAALARLLEIRQQQQQQQQGDIKGAAAAVGGGAAAAAPVPTAAAAAAAAAQQQQLSRLLGLVLAVLRSALDSDPDLNPEADPEQRRLLQAGAGAGAAGSPSRPPAVPPATSPASPAVRGSSPAAGAASSPRVPSSSAAATAGTGGGGAGGGGACPACLAEFSRLVLVAPGLVGLIPQDMQVRFRSSGAFARLCRAVRQQLAARTIVGPTAAAWCLSNLLQLLLGPHMVVTAGGAVGGGGGGGGVLSPPPESLWGGGGEVAAELAVTAAALLEHLAGGRLYGSPELAAAVSGLWPLGQRGLLVPMLAALEPRPGGVEGYSDMCCAAIELMPRLSAAFADKKIKSDVPGLLNALAFSPGVLPRLWRWLCFGLGLPRECPAAASRGLDVAALAGGYAGLHPRRARVLGLFCRVYAQLLLVLDDGEFYDLQQPLELTAARAVGTSLNSLVFHTYLPKPPADGSRPPPAPAPTDPDFALLVEWAPRLLRALYERDVRRPYCQSLLWLAPYREMFGTEDEQLGPPPRRPHHPRGGGGGGGGEFDDFDDPSAATAPDPAEARIGAFTAGAVLLALMYGGAAGSGGDEDGDGGDAVVAAAATVGGGGGGGAPPALQAKAGEGCRPQSLASLLRATPQAVPFSRRVDLLRALLAEDKRRGRWEQPMHAGGPPPIKITIRRSSLIEDAYAGLAHRGAGLKARLQVVFVNEAGMTEAGLDFGGLQKELLERVVSAGLDANYGLFTSTPDGLAYPNPAAERLDGGLALLEFMGLMFGKALYEGILLPVPFAHFFVARLQGRQPLFDDLASLDPELHRNLLQVKRYEGDVGDLCLTFSADTDFLGCPAHHELLPGGAERTVTNESRLLYCHLLADWHLNGKLGAPTAAFARGLFSLIPQASLRLFNPREFNQLLSGAAADGPGGGGGAAPLDVADMRRWTRYSGGYGPDSGTVKLFWRVVSELTPAQQSALLRFVTSCSRPPLGGFRYLQPPLTVHKVDCEASLFAALGGRDVDRLPSASTCYNMLKLPNYRRASTLKAKLLYSITSGAGFELS